MYISVSPEGIFVNFIIQDFFLSNALDALIRPQINIININTAMIVKLPMIMNILRAGIMIPLQQTPGIEGEL